MVVDWRSNLSMRPSMIIFGIKGDNLSGEFKLFVCSISSQFLSNPSPMMPAKIFHKDSCRPILTEERMKRTSRS